MTIGSPWAFRVLFLVAGAAFFWAPPMVMAQISERPSEARDSTAAAESGQVPPTAAVRSGGGEPYSHDGMAPRARAVRTDATFVIDGVLDEAAWMAATAISGLRQIVPDEGQPVSEKTEVRILYDDDHLYVGAWLWDDDRALAPRMIRRDGSLSDADFLAILFDSYHDHRVGYRLGTWPGGVQKDQTVIGDGGIGDTSWDAVWDLETSITEEGWFVEMRIPFSQLRYRDEDVQHWGFQIERRISGNGEHAMWAFSPQSEPGGVARFGHLDGIEGILAGKRLEVLPFLTGRAEYAEIPRSGGAHFDNPFRSGSDFFSNAGMDLKYRLGTAFTLDGTMNPDFGQVEQDPAVINLTALETRFQEKRPFFVEGADIFQFGKGKRGGSEAQLLYSRRIGRAPQGVVPDAAEYMDVPGSTTILGALKLSGRTASGWSVGVLDAVTDRVRAPWVDGEEARHMAEVEPRTNYLAARLRRDVRQGTGSFGLLATSVSRDLGDDGLASRLRSSAYSVGVDGSLEWDSQAWALAGKISGSRVSGSAESIARTQKSSARYIDRPDATHLDFDPAATSLSGFYGRVGLSKQAGSWQGDLGATVISPGYEVNDLGFQSWADRIEVTSNFGYRQPRVGRRLRSLNVTAGAGRTINFARQAVDSEISLSLNAQHASFNSFNASIARQFEVLDDRLSRGGPLTSRPEGYSGRLGFSTDRRSDWKLNAGFDFSANDDGGWSRRAELGLAVRLLERIELELEPNLSWNRTAAQYIQTTSDPSATMFGERYVFASLDQTTLGMEMKLLVAFNPRLTLELYAQPFISSGDYGGLMERAGPQRFEFLRYGEDVGTVNLGSDGGSTVDPDGTGANSFEVRPLDFNFRSLLGNAVLRWEWRTGSTFFLVWQQTRSERLLGVGDMTGDVGQFELGPDTRALFGLKPDNVFMFKVTYWLNP
jgi:hypothetical protein